MFRRAGGRERVEEVEVFPLGIVLVLEDLDDMSALEDVLVGLNQVAL
jgi:hypothetical protein